MDKAIDSPASSAASPHPHIKEDRIFRKPGNQNIMLLFFQGSGTSFDYDVQCLPDLVYTIPTTGGSYPDLASISAGLGTSRLDDTDYRMYALRRRVSDTFVSLHNT